MKRTLLLVMLLLILVAAFPLSAYGQVKSEITRFGSDVVISEGETESGSITVFGGDAVVEGSVENDITLFGGSLRLEGRAGGNVAVFGGNVTLGDKAVIEGDFTHFGGEVTRSPGARIEGNETTGFRGPLFGPLASFFFSVFSLLFSLLLAAAVVAVFPEQTAVLARTVDRQALPSLGVGFLATLLVPFVFLLLALIIIVGWFLIPFAAIAIPAIYFYGYVGVGRWLGERIIAATNLTYRSPVAQAVTGVLILGVIGLIPIAGWLVVIIASLIGLGAVILSRFGTGRPWMGARAAQAPPPQPEEPRGAA